MPDTIKEPVLQRLRSEICTAISIDVIEVNNAVHVRVVRSVAEFLFSPVMLSCESRSQNALKARDIVFTACSYKSNMSNRKLCDVLGIRRITTGALVSTRRAVQMIVKRRRVEMIGGEWERACGNS
jgi:hypothetical protein